MRKILKIRWLKRTSNDRLHNRKIPKNEARYVKKVDSDGIYLRGPATYLLGPATVAVEVQKAAWMKTIETDLAVIEI